MNNQLMITTGSIYDFDEELVNLVEKMAKSFEYYLPDEKLSRIWEETEVISTNYPDFEAVYFIREIDGNEIYISDELEFFPLYVVYLSVKYGAPNFIKRGRMFKSDTIGIEENREVIEIGYSNPENQQVMYESKVELKNERDIHMNEILELANDYIQDIL